MTTQELQSEFERKKHTLDELAMQGLITHEAYESLLERVKDETFFAVSVQCDIDALPVTVLRNGRAY